MTQEEIKSYLVKLAYKIDKQSEAGFLKSLTGGSGALSKLTGAAGAAAGAVALVSTALAASVATVVSFTASAANANKENERFARMMFASERAAYSFNTALQAMGKSMDDIATMTPEEYQQFRALRNLSSSIGLPADYNQTMRGVRDTMFEVTRLKVIAAQAMSIIAYYIAKYLELPMQRLRQNLRNLGDWLQKNIPKIADIAGKAALVVVRLAEGVGWLVEQGWNLANLVGEKMPSSFAYAAAGLTAFFAVMAAGPIGWFIAAIVGLLLLLDDIATWQRGGDSLFGGIYEFFANGFSSVFDLSAFDDLFKAWDFLIKKVNEFLDTLFDVDEEGEGIKALFEELGKIVGYVLDDYITKLKNIFTIAGNLIHIVTSILRALTGQFSWDDFINGFDWSGLDMPRWAKDLIGLNDSREDPNKTVDEMNRILESLGLPGLSQEEIRAITDKYSTNVTVQVGIDGATGEPTGIKAFADGVPIGVNATFGTIDGLVANMMATGGYAP